MNNHNESNEQIDMPMIGGAAQLCSRMAYHSPDEQVRGVLRIAGNAAQEEFSYMKSHVDRLVADLQSATFRLNAIIDALKLPSSAETEFLTNHIQWLENEAKGHAVLQDLIQERFDLIRKAAGITEPVPSHPDKWANLATVIREKVTVPDEG